MWTPKGFTGHVIALDHFVSLAPAVTSTTRFGGLAWYDLLDGAEVFQLDGPRFGSGASFNRSRVWIRAIDGLQVFVPNVELAPLHDRAIVFETPIGEGELVVSGLRLGIPAANGSSPPARMMQWALRALVHAGLLRGGL